MRPFAMMRIPWSPWGVSLAILGDNRPEKPQGELAGARKQMAGYLKELGV
jgi:hypothetical protein